MPPYYADPARRPPLAPDRFSLQSDEADFFKALTGIHDDDELRDHILRVQASAYEIYGYPCIHRFSFLRLKISRLDAYPKALSLLHSRTSPILLDIGCCFGNDTRKAVVDGWPVHDVVASDLRQAFWDCGHDLFKSTPESFPAAFVPGDVFDPHFLDISSPSTQDTPLSALQHSITPLLHRVSAIHASAFFHLFSESKQAELASRLAALLIPAKGSIIFGQHNAMPQMGYRTSTAFHTYLQGPPPEQDFMFCHSPQSWSKLWSQDVFGPLNISVSVNARLIEVERSDKDNKFWVMNWSVEVL